MAERKIVSDDFPAGCRDLGEKTKMLHSNLTTRHYIRSRNAVAERACVYHNVEIGPWFSNYVVRLASSTILFFVDARWKTFRPERGETLAPVQPDVVHIGRTTRRLTWRLHGWSQPIAAGTGLDSATADFGRVRLTFSRAAAYLG
jgi:hypothetical protein